MNREDGFTLLELLVAIAILSLLAVPMVTSVQRGVAVWQTAHSDVSVSERVILRRNRVAGWLRAAYPFVPGRNAGAVEHPFEGNENSMSFLTPLHPDINNNTAYIARLELIDDPDIEDANAKLLSVSIAADHEQTVSFGDNSVLAQGIETAEFRYLDSGTGDWLDTWQNKTNLPRAVKISVVFFDKKKVWPQLVVGLKTEEWAHCAYDDVSILCRTEE